MRFAIYTVAATQHHAIDCGIPLMHHGEVEAPDARTALLDFLGADAPGITYVPHADYRDAAVAYESKTDPARPLVWLAAHHVS